MSSHLTCLMEANIDIHTAELIMEMWCRQCDVTNLGPDILQLTAMHTTSLRRNKQRFTLTDFMGMTQQGYLYMAEDYHFPRRKVIVKKGLKVLVDNNMTIRQGRAWRCEERFLQEIRTHKQLTDTTGALHGHLVKLLGAWQDHTSLYMAMEFCPGGTLQQLVDSRARLDRGTPEWLQRVLHLFHDVVRGVEAMHAAGVCHNDLCLANVMLAADGRAKIIDLGVADRFPAPGMRRTGRWQYQSPEMFWQRPLPDGRANDVWAVGVMHLTMLTGEVLYHRADAEREPRLRLALDKRLDVVLDEEWKLEDVGAVPPLALDLLNAVFLPQDRRIGIAGLRTHPYFAGDTRYCGGQVLTHVEQVEAKEQEQEWDERWQVPFCIQSQAIYRLQVAQRRVRRLALQRADLRKQAHERLEDVMREAQQREEEMEARRKAFEAESQRAIEELKHEMDQQRKQLSGEVSRLEHEGAAQQEAIAGLQRAMEAKDAEIAALKAQAQEREKVIVQMESLKERLESRTKAVREAERREKAQVARLQQEASAQGALSAVEQAQTIEERDAELGKLKLEMDHLREQLEQEESKQEMEAKDAEIAVLKDKLGTQHRELTGLATRLMLQVQDLKTMCSSYRQMRVKLAAQHEARQMSREEEAGERAPGFLHHRYFEQPWSGEAAASGEVVDGLPPGNGGLVRHVCVHHDAPRAAAPDNVRKPRAHSI